MGELFVGTLLYFVKLFKHPKMRISIPELDWELEGTQTVPMLNAAFERIKAIPDPAEDDEDEDKDSDPEYPKIVELLPHRDRCFAQARVFSLAEVLKENLGSNLAGIAFGIDEGMKDPLYTVLYWDDEA